MVSLKKLQNKAANGHLFNKAFLFEAERRNEENKKVK